MPQLRQNIITGDWVVIAPERAKRPNEFVAASQPRTGDIKKCPFCPEGDPYKNERLKHYETDEIFIIPNKFPAFVPNTDQISNRSYHVEDGFYNAKPSLGGHDVLIIKDHKLELDTFAREVWRDLLVLSRERYRFFDKKEKNHYSMLIYNEKPNAGASIEHPHAQIFSSNIVPNLVSRELRTSEHYWQVNGASAFQDLVAHEEKSPRRVIYQNDHYLAFTQYAARFPFETWIVPKYQQSRFDHVSDTQLAALVPTMMAVFKKINRVLKTPPLNFFIHSAPNSIEQADYYRWHLEIAPRLSNYGGFELGSGVIIDIVSPELAADYLNGRELPA